MSLDASLENQTISGPGAPAWLQACRYEVLSGEVVADVLGIVTGGSPNSSRPAEPDDEWGALFCPGSPQAVAVTPNVALTGLLAAWPIGDAPPQIVLDVLIARSRAAIVLPVQVGQGAPFGDLDAPLITQLPTWLWIDPAVWADRSATPPAVFGVSVTATATPANVTFANDAGDVVDCGPNLGPAYDFARTDDQQHSDCTLTYHHSTAVGDHHLTTTITWDVTYVCSAFCGSGAIPGFTITSTRPVRVAEMQALLISSNDN
ncbi:MAG: hypothetical protein AAFN30_18300 [Actinomycetota bacterium]